MRTKLYFKKKNQIVDLLKGRYGNYAKFFGNSSEKKMQELGFEIVSLTREEVLNYNKLHTLEQEDIKKLAYNQKMQERAEQVSICLKSEPLEIGDGNHLWGAITSITGDMQEAYHGCGKITAYLKDGKIIAFHYGYERPDNAPTCEAIKCEVSGMQILF